MCDPRIYARYRCADPVTGLCVCDVNGPYASKEGCEKSWQCHLNQFDSVHEHRPAHLLSHPHRLSPASGAEVVANVPSSAIRISEPSFYVQQ